MKIKPLQICIIVTSLLTIYLIANIIISNRTQEISYNSPLKIAWYGNLHQQKQNQLLLSEFKKENPNIQITVENYQENNYWNYLSLSIASETIPDVFFLSHDMIEDCIYSKILFNIDDIANKVDYKYPSVIEIAQNENSCYALPIGITTPVTVINTDLVERMKHIYPSSYMGYNELIDYSKKLRNSMVNRGYTLSYPLEDFGIDIDSFIFYLHSKNKQILDSSDSIAFLLDDIIDYLTIFDLYRKEGLIPPIARSIQNSSDLIKDKIMNQRALAFGIIDLDELPLYKTNNKDSLKVSYASPLMSSKSILKGTFLGISKSSKNVNDSKKLLEYWIYDKKANSIWQSPYGITYINHIDTISEYQLIYNQLDLDYHLELSFLGKPTLSQYFEKIYTDYAFKALTIEEASILIYDKFASIFEKSY